MQKRETLRPHERQRLGINYYTFYLLFLLLAYFVLCNPDSTGQTGKTQCIKAEWSGVPNSNPNPNPCPYPNPNP